MYTSRKRFEFNATRKLVGVGEHPFTEKAGHIYIVTVEMKSPSLNPQGIIISPKELIPINLYLDEHLNYKHLNFVMKPPPSLENIAKFLYEKFKERYPMLNAVEVNTARYEQDSNI